MGILQYAILVKLSPDDRAEQHWNSISSPRIRDKNHQVSSITCIEICETQGIFEFLIIVSELN